MKFLNLVFSFVTNIFISTLCTSLETGIVQISNRVKRATGTTLDSLVVNLTLVSKQSASTSAVDIGDTFLFQIKVDLPGITSANAIDMKIEFFAVNSITGVGGYCLCDDVNVANVGQNVQFAGNTLDGLNFIYNTKNAPIKATYYLPGVNTGGKTDSGISNTFYIPFSIMLCDLPEVIAGSQFYLTTGLMYGNDTYIWLGQMLLTSSPSGQQFDSVADFVTPVPTNINKGDGIMLDISALVTNPSGVISLKAFQPLGYEDVFSFGEFKAEVGNSYDCSDPTAWYNTPIKSSSGLSNVKQTLKYDFLLNFDGSRNQTSADNVILFHIPIYVMNLETVPTGVSRDVAFILNVGTDSMWTGSHTFLIGNYTAPATINTVTFVKKQSMFNTGVGVYIGNSAVFQITINVPSGWADLTMTLIGATGVVPIMADFSDGSGLAYIPPWYTVSTLRSDNMTMDVKFGKMKNALSTSINVTVQVAFQVTKSAAIGSQTVQCNIGAMLNSLTIPIVANPLINGTNATAQIDVVPYPYTVDPSLVPLGGQVCLELNVTVPVGATADDIIFDVIPDTSVGSLNTHVCRAKVENVGKNLPCVQSNSLKMGYRVDQGLYSYSNSYNTEYDYAVLDVGNTCPNSVSSKSDDNIFTITGCIEVPAYQPNYAPLVNFLVNVGLKQDGTTIWLSTNTYTTHPSTSYYTGPTIVAGTCFEDNINLVGPTGIGGNVVSASHCQYLCQITPPCIMFVYGKSSLSCFGITSLPVTKSVDTTSISGPAYCTETCISDNIYYTSTAASSTSFAGYLLDEFVCQAACQADSQCLRFYFYKVDGSCTLSYSLVGVWGTNTDYKSGPKYCTVPVTPSIFSLDDRIAIDSGGVKQFYVNQGFSIDYLIKLQAQTFNSYKFTIAPNAGFKICRIRMTHIGENFPCTEAPSADSLPTDNVALTWSDPTASYKCGTGASLLFKGLTNWGRNPMVSDLTADDNSIVVTVWYQVCSGSGAVNLTYSLMYDLKNSLTLGGTSQVSVVNSLKTLSTVPISTVTMESLIGPSNIVYRLIPKILRFNLTIPKNFQNDIVMNVVNNDYVTDKHIDFCDIQVVYSGGNVPCMNPNTTMTNISTTSKLYKDEIVYPSMKFSASSVCYVQYSADAKESVVSIEVVFRVKDYIPVDSTITLAVTITSSAAPKSNFVGNYTFTVKEPNTTAIPLSTLNPNDVKIYSSTLNNSGITIPLAQYAWIPFIVQIPAQTISQVEISVFLPPFGNRPHAHLRDVKFDACGGRNIVCLSPLVDLRRNYPTVFNKSDYLMTFMSNDILTVNLGYVVNTGFTQIFGANSDTDNQFSVRILVQMGDYLANNTTFNLYFSIKTNNIITVSNQLIVMSRTATTTATRQCCERGNIVISLNPLLPLNTTYGNGTVANFTAVIRHNDNMTSYYGNQSLAEGQPDARIRILAPKYMVFDGESIVSNYSFPINVSYTTGAAPVELVFTVGIFFPDIISLNFSMLVDPDGIQPFGKGVANTTVALFPLCRQTTLFSYPPPNMYVTCGSASANTILTNMGDCTNNEIPINNDCQVRASSFMSDDVAPFFSVFNDSVWSPAIRDGFGWVDFLKFNLGGTARITKMRINSPASLGVNNFRQVSKIRIEAGNNCENFNFVMETGIPFDNIVIFPKTIIASNIKITILLVDLNNVESTPLALNSIKFYGCLPFNDSASCCQDTSINGTDPTLYRHVTVDSDKNIIYFCDRKSYLPGMYCYFNNRGSGTNLWTKLPHYIAYIIGYSKTSGRTYFRGNGGLAVFSTFNAQLIELTNPNEIPPDIISPVLFPGASTNDLTSTKIPFTTYNGDFYGLYDGKTLLTTWSSCCP